MITIGSDTGIVATDGADYGRSWVRQASGALFITKIVMYIILAGI
jgi:hypothetical protein